MSRSSDPHHDRRPPGPEAGRPVIVTMLLAGLFSVLVVIAVIGWLVL